MEKALKPIEEAIEAFTMSEFGEEMDEEITTESIVPIAFTTLGDNEELEIQVKFNVEQNTLEQHVTGIYLHAVEYTRYESIEHAAIDLSSVDFEAITRLDKLDVDELIEQDEYLQQEKINKF